MLTLSLPLKWFYGGLRLFSDVWIANAVLSKEWWKFNQIHHYGFNVGEKKIMIQNEHKNKKHEYQTTELKAINFTLKNFMESKSKSNQAKVPIMQINDTSWKLWRWVCKI